MQTNILTYLESTADRFPDKLALTDDRSDYTWSQLLEAAMRVGTAVCAEAENREPVGLYMDKTSDAVCAMLGAVYAGCFYSVLNTELPPQRLQQIESVLNPKIIISSAILKRRASEIFPGRTVISFEELSSAENDCSLLASRRNAAIDTDPLYVNFTSGSTGVPKGIAVGHRSVIDFIDCFTELFSISDSDVIANQAPFDFDVSVKDIYSSLKTGATLAVIPRRLFSAPTDLVDYLCEKRVSTLIWAVSALCLITTFHALEYRTPDTIRKILFSGEVMPAKALKNLREHLPEAMFVNLYGPTEITCNCTYHVLSNDADYSAGIPIGIPFPNESVFLLDDNDGLITRTGLPGELCVRGSSLALGYYSCPDQNTLHFTQNPLNPFYPELIYRTGDLACYAEDGELMFCGRKDFQIKYMGHRIELEEIERTIAELDGIERCCCVFDEKHSRLKAFYVGTVEKEAVVEQMKIKLPVFMLPGIVRRLDALPLTKNGKTDRKMLAEMK